MKNPMEWKYEKKRKGGKGSENTKTGKQKKNKHVPSFSSFPSSSTILSLVLLFFSALFVLFCFVLFCFSIIFILLPSFLCCAHFSSHLSETQHRHSFFAMQCLVSNHQKKNQREETRKDLFSLSTIKLNTFISAPVLSPRNMSTAPNTACSLLADASSEQLSTRPRKSILGVLRVFFCVFFVLFVLTFDYCLLCDFYLQKKKK